MATLAAVFVLGAGTLALSGCGGSSSEAGGNQESIHLVYVNWVEGVALAHVLDAVLEDSLGLQVERTEVTGAGTAFSSVASGDADVFTEVWLPFYHEDGWERYKDELTKVGQWYEGTSAGLVVPTYTDIHSVEDLARYREELGGEIHGIEAGANINENTRLVLEDSNIEGFEVVSASSPATWSAVQRAIENEEPIVATGWKPHWKWGRFDLRYLEGSKTGQNPHFGDAENIVMLADTTFGARYPERVVQFFENVKVNDEALASLMQPFRPESGVSDPMAAAREWIQEHRALVDRWVPDEAEAASGAATATATSMR